MAIELASLQGRDAKEPSAAEGQSGEGQRSEKAAGHSLCDPWPSARTVCLVPHPIFMCVKRPVQDFVL